jgi:hypothetical protein
MLNTLAKIYDDGGTLVSVAYTLFEGDPRFITAIGLRFESESAVFRAVPDDDTLEATLGPLVPGPRETLIEDGDSELWLSCMCSRVRGAWRLTNQQGYTDGIRLEFGQPDGMSRATVEMVVSASAIQLFGVMARLLKPKSNSENSFVDFLPPSHSYWLTNVRLDIPSRTVAIFKAKLNAPEGKPVWARAWLSTEEGTLAESASPRLMAGDEVNLRLRSKARNRRNSRTCESNPRR